MSEWFGFDVGRTEVERGKDSGIEGETVISPTLVNNLYNPIIEPRKDFFFMGFLPEPSSSLHSSRYIQYLPSTTADCRPRTDRNALNRVGL